MGVRLCNIYGYVKKFKFYIKGNGKCIVFFIVLEK